MKQTKDMCMTSSDSLANILVIARTSADSVGRVVALRDELNRLGDVFVSASDVADQLDVCLAQVDILSFELNGGLTDEES